MILKRWQFLIGALAIFAASLACSGPAWSSTPSPIPIPSPTASQVSTQAPRIVRPIKTAPSPLLGDIEGTVSALRSLNIRQEATEASAGIGVLYHGDKVSLTGECLEGWARIRYKGVLAWVNGKYIDGDTCKEDE